MKKQRNILRFSGLMLIFSVLFTHVFSREFFSVPPVEQSKQVTGSSDKEEKQSVKHDQSPDESEEQEQQTLSQLTFEVVVPSYAFDFGVPFVALFSPGFEFLVWEAPVPNISNPTIIDSYFEKLFEHHIAINAP